MSTKPFGHINIYMSENKDNWVAEKWRPGMGWMYMTICIFDFVLFPIMWTALQSATGATVEQWNPLTLQGAGLFHMAMGAILGVTAFGRTQEKIAGVVRPTIARPTND